MMNEQEIALLQQLERDILKHFQNNNNFNFTARYNGWDNSTKLLFLRLADDAHNRLRLDCWFVLGGCPVRFGRKEKGQIYGRVAIRIEPRKHNFAVQLSTNGWLNLIETKLLDEAITFNDDLMTKIIKIQNTNIRPRGNDKLYWPDNYNQDQGQGHPQPNGVARSASPRNIIYYGPPGTGKTYALQNELKENYKQRYRFVTFHQSYGYEEFVEGLRPVLGEITEQIHYKIHPGAFLDLCRQADDDDDENNRYAMVIDEINRGNISKIFGELITLIEIDKRKEADQAISATLAYSGEEFSVPSNVDIIGTMNTADRSLALVDTALRRRFEFIPMMPDTSEDGPLKNTTVNKDDVVINVRAMLEKINLRIEALYDRDHIIGHAYFIGINDFEELKKVFRNRILPLLEEYFFDDWERIRLVLGDNQKNDINLQFVTVNNNDNYVAELFGNNNHDLDPNSIRKRYQINELAFDQPQAYQLIY